MSHFEWTGPLTVEEKSALRNYKDFSWMAINSRLRNENALDGDDEEVILLDGAIQKGRCTEPVTLFRATGSDFLSIESNVIKPDKAFLSTSTRDDCLGSFFEPNPVKL